MIGGVKLVVWRTSSPQLIARSLQRRLLIRTQDSLPETEAMNTCVFKTLEVIKSVSAPTWMILKTMWKTPVSINEHGLCKKEFCQDGLSTSPLMGHTGSVEEGCTARTLPRCRGKKSTISKLIYN
jgi:hypothetical protein